MCSVAIFMTMAVIDFVNPVPGPAADLLTHVHLCHAAEGAHASVSNQFSEAFNAVSAPFTNLSTVIASQLTVGAD